MDQAQILNLLSRQVSAMEGGRRRRRPTRKRGGVLDIMPEPQVMVGGRRRKTTKKMPAALKAFFESKRRKPARKRGRGLVGGALVGGSKAQDIYEQYAARGQRIPDYVLKLLKAGVEPMTDKERLVEQIRRLEKKYGLSQTSATALKKYTVDALKKIKAIYSKWGTTLAYPPIKTNRDEYDDEGRFEDSGYFAPVKGVAQQQEELSELEEEEQ